MINDARPQRRHTGMLAAGWILVLLGLGAVGGAAKAQDPQEDAAFARKVFGDVNAPRPVDVGNGETKLLLPLEIAAARNDAAGARMLRALAAAGADIDRKDPEGRAAVHVAAMFEAVTNLRVLHALGADLNARDADGDTPLHIAAAKVNPELVQLLVNMRAQPDLRDREGLTPLLMLLSQADALLRFGGASAEDMTKVVSALLGAGADPDASSLSSNRTPLMWAVALPAEAALPIARILLGSGADPNRTDHSGRTALHHAIEAGTGHGNSIAARDKASPAVVRLLLAAGADPNHQDAAGRSPLFPAAERACSYGLEEAAIFDDLIAAGADSTLQDAQGRTPLDLGDCPFLKKHVRPAHEKPLDIAGERVDARAFAALDPDSKQTTLIGIIRRILMRDISGRRALRAEVGRAARMAELMDAAEAQRRAKLLDRYLNHVLGVVTWKEEGPKLIRRIGEKLDVPLDDRTVTAVLEPVFGRVPDGSSDRALRAEYYWTESWRDIFRLLAQTPDGWHPRQSDGGITFTDRQLADKVTKLQEDARAFATAFAAPTSP